MNTDAINGDILDFVWIEKYRNIKKQSFRFSTKYHYTYDEKNNTLIRTTATSFINCFFDDNIEINAVVGENGVGKTTLFRAIFEVAHSLYYDEDEINATAEGTLENIEDVPKIVLVFRDGTVYCFFANLAWSKSSLKQCDKDKYAWNLKESKISNYRKGALPNRQLFMLPFFYHSSTLDYGAFSRFELLDSFAANAQSRHSTIRNAVPAHNTDSLSLSQYDLSTSASLSEKNNSGHNRLIKNSVYEYFHEEVFKQIDLIVSQDIKKDKFKNLFGFSLPEVLNANVISDNQITALFNRFLSPPKEEITDIINSPNILEKKISEIIDDPKYKEIEKIIGKIQSGRSHWLDYSVETLNALYNSEFLLKKMKRNPSDTKLKTSLEWGLLVSAILLYAYHPAIPIQSQGFNMRDIYMEVCNARVDANISAWEQLKKYIQLLDNSSIIKSMPADADKLEEWNKRKTALYTFINLIEEEPKLIETASPRIIIYTDNASFNIKSSLFDFFESYRNLSTFLDFLKFSWPLSSGEEAKFALFSRINSALKHQTGEYVYLLFDEADMLLHPRWQQSIIKDIVVFMKEYFIPCKIKHVQIIIATHSPIMLSDIPKQNIQFLRKDDCDAGINLDTEETFAANIYSLFKNSFFLDNSMIGAFAESELKELAKDIHNMNDTSDFARIKLRINAIGDEFIRKHFLELYHQKKDEATEVEMLQHEVESLKKRVALLESSNAKEGE